MCDRCERLAAENASLKDELAEWRRQSEEGVDALAAADDTGRWMLALGVPRLIAQVAMLMVGRAGRIVSSGMIGETGSKDWDALSDPDASGKICIYKLRRALAAQGIEGGIETVWAVGYRMSSATARAVQDLVDEVEA